MKVTLISHTQDAVNLLLYTKSTRLTQGLDTRRKIKDMSAGQRAQELAYMATTIPSSWEFVDYVFEITGCSRAFTHQFVRTRTGSYAQQTMRMLPMEKFSYVTGPTILGNPQTKRAYEDGMKIIQDLYDWMIAKGVAIEDARGILPTNICTNIIAKFNLRTLAELSRSRGGKRTQGEYQEALAAMQEAIFYVHPWARDFLSPDRLDPVKRLEAMIEKDFNGDKELRTAAFKQLDIIRKSL